MTETAATNSAPADTAPAAAAPAADAGAGGGGAAPAAAAPAGDTPAAAPAAAPRLFDGGDKKNSADDGKAQPGAGEGADASKPEGQTSEADKPDGEKPKDGEGKEGEDNVQAYQDFTLPEGMEMDKEVFTDLEPIFKGKGMSQDEVQSVVDAGAKILSKQVAKMHDAHNAQVQKWHDQTVAEYGKDGKEDFEKKQGIAQAALDKHFTPEFKKFANSYGLVNHPEFFGHFYKLGLATREDNLDMPAGGAGGGEKTLGEIWYPNSNS